VFKRLPHDMTVTQAAKLIPAAIVAEWRAKVLDAKKGA
jgi:hypothetical protein